MHALKLRRESQSTTRALPSKRRRSSVLLLSAALISVAGAACDTLDKPGPKGSVTVIPVDDRPAQLTAAPRIEQNNMLRLTGYFPTQPLRINFDMLFQNAGGQWRLFGLSVATPQAPAQSDASQAPAAKAAPARR